MQKGYQQNLGHVFMSHNHNDASQNKLVLSPMSYPNHLAKKDWFGKIFKLLFPTVTGLVLSPALVRWQRSPPFPRPQKLKFNMSPIALKDKRIQELTKQLVKRFVTGEVSGCILRDLFSNVDRKFMSDLAF